MKPCHDHPGQVYGDSSFGVGGGVGAKFLMPAFAETHIYFKFQEFSVLGLDFCLPKISIMFPKEKIYILRCRFCGSSVAVGVLSWCQHPLPSRNSTQASGSAFRAETRNSNLIISRFTVLTNGYIGGINEMASVFFPDPLRMVLVLSKF